MEVPRLEERELLMKTKMKTNMGREFKYNADYNTRDAEQSGQETLKVTKKGKGVIVGLFGVLVRLMIRERKVRFAN
jgi:hypothetical protein